MIILVILWAIITLGIGCAFSYIEGKEPGRIEDWGFVVVFWPLLIFIILTMSPFLLAQYVGKTQRK